MTSTTYNGWANRGTWAVNLWFGDDWAEMNESGETLRSDYLRDYVQDYINQVIGGRLNGFINDMLDLDRINWDELASHYTVAGKEDN